jgi:hypothetical protein
MLFAMCVSKSDKDVKGREERGVLVPNPPTLTLTLTLTLILTLTLGPTLTLTQTLTLNLTLNHERWLGSYDGEHP